MITLVSSPKQHLPKDMQNSVCHIVCDNTVIPIVNEDNLVKLVTLDHLLTTQRSASIIYERWTISGVSVPM